MEQTAQQGRSGIRDRRYLEASKQIQRRLRSLLARYHGRQVRPSEIEPQEFNVSLCVEDGRLVYQSVADAKSGKHYSFVAGNRTGVRVAEGPLDREPGLPLGRGDITDFNRRFLSFFEPVLTYGELAASEEEQRADQRWATRPLWLAALEVEEKQMRYTLFAVGQEPSIVRGGLCNPDRFFQWHRIYDHVPSDQGDREELPYDLTSLYRKLEKTPAGLDESRKYLPVVVAIVEQGEDLRQVYDGEARGGRGSDIGNGVSLNIISLKRHAAQEIDEELCRVLPGLRKYPGREATDRFKDITLDIAKRQLSEIEIGPGCDLDLSEHPWYESLWDGRGLDSEELKERRSQILQYFVWLRALSIARTGTQAPEGETTTEEVDNFKTYVYFPNPDLSGSYIHTVTLAFPGPHWPNPDLLLLLDRSLPKLFVRSGIRLSQRVREKQTRHFAHQTAGQLSIVWGEHEMLAEAAEYALWNTLMLVEHIWGGTPLMREDLIIDDFPEWKGLTGIEVAKKICIFSAIHAINRAAKRPKLSSYSRGEVVNEEVETLLQNVRIHALRHEGSPDAFIEKLGLRIIDKSDGKKSLIIYKLASIVYHHALWQAMYHGFISFVDDVTDDRFTAGSRVIVEFNDSLINIYNKESERIRSFRSEGHSEEYMDEETRDGYFMSEVSEKFGFIQISGPRRSQGMPGYWLTSIEWND